MQLHAGRDVKPISDFRKDTAAVLRKLKATKHPLLLTQNGRSVAVLLDVDEFERMEYEREFLAAIAQGRKDAAKGRIRPHADVMADARKLLAGK
ncbi:MAG: type II toxin-antitoxin system Phd/YefM family antitoxin [Elusimicrobia bacterium]|nr:type II toxin-antitoxin system Phd/YefM family antitoxin [Elusimicrobiota bacterium]